MRRTSASGRRRRGTPSHVWGQVLAVRLKPQGWRVAADTAAGATSLPIRNGEDAEGSGTVQVNGQVVAWSSWDAATGALQLVDELAADADAGDNVWLYDTKRSAVVAEYEADVDVDDWDGEPPTAILEDGLDESLPVGPREPGEGEWVRMYHDATEDEWYVDKTRGTANGRGIRFESDDVYALTAADIAAGSARLFLTHRPVDESVKLWWRTVAQEPTEYTVNADAQTITLPLADFAAAGDRVWVHYAYRKSLAREVVVPDVPGPVPLTHVNTAGVNVYTTISNTQSISLGSVLPGDLIAFACIGDGGTIACPDPRMTLALSTTYSGNPLKIWLGKDNGLGSPLDIDVHYDSSSFLCEFSMAAVVVRPDSPVDWIGVVSDQSGATGSTVPGVSGGSGVVALAFSDGGTSADYGWYWPSPYTAQVGFGTYLYVTSAVQQGSMIADAVLSTTGGHARRAILLGIGLG